MTWRLFGGVSAILAGMAARKAITKSWQLTTRRDPPANPAHPATEWHEAVAFAVVSGAAIGRARMLATRKAAGYYRKSTGQLPCGMEEVT
jgi:hypothetical protein